MEEVGKITKHYLGEEFKLEVLRSAAGYYIGTATHEGIPASRESVEYWDAKEDAEVALETGDWSQRPSP